MDLDALRAFIAAFPDTLIVEGGADIYAIHDPDGDYEQRPRQGWATVMTSDAYDSASDLDRPGVFRLNIGLPRDRFRELVDPDAEYDTTALDVLFPHPVYGSMNWVSVLNPDTTWPLVQQLLADAHAFAVRKHDNAARRREARR
ncbi:DUF6194 family protein [Pseudonocardia humida]|uniref:DUF6194 domain-containing protein n=1 Tax=Pseudonocardia humida TaxID=2800819 RepID=A0ABT1A0H8_9PSEU|nr:DUF6194 family protein [Pseudonocardia humida]MCO1656507.1 hypothetical protein [Pseudonocardia humida]